MAISSLYVIELQNDLKPGHISPPLPVLHPKAVRILLGRVGRRGAPRIFSAPFFVQIARLSFDPLLGAYRPVLVDHQQPPFITGQETSSGAKAR